MVPAFLFQFSVAQWNSVLAIWSSNFTSGPAIALLFVRQDNVSTVFMFSSVHEYGLASGKLGMLNVWMFLPFWKKKENLFFLITSFAISGV